MGVFLKLCHTLDIRPAALLLHDADIAGALGGAYTLEGRIAHHFLKGRARSLCFGIAGSTAVRVPYQRINELVNSRRDYTQHGSTLGHEREAEWHADRISGARVPEPHPLGGQPVEVRRARIPVAVQPRTIPDDLMCTICLRPFVLLLIGWMENSDAKTELHHYI